MATIYTKVHEYNKETQAIVVSFASTETKSQNPDSYEKINYSIHYLVGEGASQQDLKDALSKVGLDWCETHCKKEMLDGKPEKQTEVENLVGTSWSKDLEKPEAPDIDGSLDLTQLKVDLGLT
jgi:hypothetical protein